MLKDHKAVTQVRFEPAASRSQVKHSITEPLRSLHQFVPAHEILVPVTLVIGEASEKYGLPCSALSQSLHCLHT